LTHFSFVLSQSTRLTDRQTDGQTEFSSLDRVCIPCSTVKSIPDPWLWILKEGQIINQHLLSTKNIEQY